MHQPMGRRAERGREDGMRYLFEWEETARYSTAIEAGSVAEAHEKFNKGEYTAKLDESILDDESTIAASVHWDQS